MFKTRIHVFYYDLVFLYYCSKWIQVYLSIRTIFSISIMFFLFPYFTPKLFCFLCIPLVVCPCRYFTNFLVEFSFIILECSVLFIFIELVPVSFEFPFFRQYLLIYFFQLYSQTCLLLSFLVFHSNVSLCVFPSLVVLLVDLVSLFVPSRFCISVWLPLVGYQFYQWLILILHKLACFQLCYLLGYFFMIYLRSMWLSSSL